MLLRLAIALILMHFVELEERKIVLFISCLVLVGLGEKSLKYRINNVL